MCIFGERSGGSHPLASLWVGSLFLRGVALGETVTVIGIEQWHFGGSVVLVVVDRLCHEEGGT